MNALANALRPVVAKATSPTGDAPVLTSPPCLIMLGGLGDLLIALCIAWHYSKRFNARCPVLTAPRFQNVLAGCSYVKSVGYSGPAWHGYEEAKVWARNKFPHVFPLHVGEREILANLKTTHFCHEQYRLAGVEGRYGEFPLVFDKRDEQREARLVLRARGVDPRPVFVYTLTGNSSPLPCADTFRHYLHAKWGKQLRLVDASALSLSHFQDLLGLLDVSIGALAIDTALTHLMPASTASYISLVNDTKEPWWSSVPRGNVALTLGYTKVMESLPVIDGAISKMLQAREIVPAPVEIAVPEVSVASTRPCVVTLACGDMLRVWHVASRTWNPWCAARGITLSVFTKPPLPQLHPSWNKLQLVLDALEKHDVVWWADSDITVARPDASLPDSDAGILFSQDWNGLCAGMFRARSTPWTKGFLRAALLLGDVRDPDDFGKGCGVKWEQNAFKALLRDFPACSSHISLLPREFVADRNWKSGPGSQAGFNHFGGMANAQRIAAMRRVHAI